MSATGRTFQIAMAVVALIGVGGLVGAVAMAHRAKKESCCPVEVYKADLPALFDLPEFSLTDQGRRQVTRETLAGHVWIADFVFTRCPGPCPIMSGRMAELQKHFASDGELRFVSITVDPTYDTPEVLQDYARRYRADGRWLFLTGPMEAVYDLSINGFKLGAPRSEPASGGLITHSTKFVLVDRSGRVRGYYDGIDVESMDRLRADVRALLDVPTTQPADAEHACCSQPSQG